MLFRSDVRKISYYTGAVFFLCMDAIGRKIENDFQSELTAYEQNPVDTDGVEAQVRPYDFIGREYAALMEEKEAKARHTHHPSGYRRYEGSKIQKAVPRFHKGTGTEADLQYCVSSFAQQGNDPRQEKNV